MTNQLFFNFDDLKPGDEGEDTISLHVTNDSWACMDMNITQDVDVDCTDSEVTDDPNCLNPDNGELDEDLNFVFWTDDGNNVLETDENVFASGSASTVLNSKLILADSTANHIGGNIGDPLTASDTFHIGKAWCFGTLTQTPVTAGQGEDPTVNPGVTCDGSLMDNAAQTDKLMADITFRAEQHRNNLNFQCNPAD